jgi:ABC-2 type transport system permease protein
MAHYEQQLARQQRMVDWLRFVSPAILFQEALHDVAGTSNNRYQYFSHQVDQFYREWQSFFLPKVLHNIPLMLADYERFPRFRYTEQSWPELHTRLLTGLLGLLIPMGFLSLFSVRRMRHYPVMG